MDLSRREVLGTVCGTIAGLALSAGPNAFSSVQSSPETYWKPIKLDPAESSAAAYEGFFHHGYGCCYGAFKGIVGVMGQKYGSPYNSFPLHMMEVGKSGISEWGTICGALLGIASAWSLFWGRKDRDPMVDELFSWYEKQPLPFYKPKVSLGIEYDVPASAPKSVLCHVSVSKWCYEHGYAMKSKERSERCARVTGSVTERAVEIMNAKIGQTDFAITEMSGARKSCARCHDADKKSDIAKGKMNCKACHSGMLRGKITNHPKKTKLR